MIILFHSVMIFFFYFMKSETNFVGHIIITVESGKLSHTIKIKHKIRMTKWNVEVSAQ